MHEITLINRLYGNVNKYISAISSYVSCTNLILLTEITSTESPRYVFPVGVTDVNPNILAMNGTLNDYCNKIQGLCQIVFVL